MLITGHWRVSGYLPPKKELRKELKQLEGDTLSAAIMDDEGMGEGDEGLRAMEKRLNQIRRELKKLEGK